MRRRWEEKLGVSWVTIWRQIKRLRGRERDGVGRRSEVSEEERKAAVFKVKALLERSIHGEGKEMPVDLAIKILRQKGEIKFDLTATQYFYWVRIYGLGEEVYIPKRFRRSKPNDLWQFDFTGGKVFYPVGPDRVKVKGRLYTTGYYADKKGGNLRVWLGMFKDDYSGAVTGRLIIRAGEDWEAATELFLWAIEEKDINRWGLPYGIPSQVYTDPAPWAHRASAFVKGLQRLGVVHFTHMPGRAQSKGKVERFFLSEQRRLENLWGILAGQTVTLTEVNERLWKFLKGWNQREHPNAGERKIRMWLRVNESGLRLPAGGVKDVFYRVDVREAKGWKIRWRGKEYRAPRASGEFEIYEIGGKVYAFDPVERLRWELVEYTAGVGLPEIVKEYEEFKKSWDLNFTLEDLDRVLDSEVDDRVLYLPPRGEEVVVEDERVKEPMMEGVAQTEHFLRCLGRYYEVRGVVALPPILQNEVIKFLSEPHRQGEIETYAARIKKLIKEEQSYGKNIHQW